jgi:hypothetical protein
VRRSACRAPGQAAVALAEGRRRRDAVAGQRGGRLDERAVDRPGAVGLGGLGEHRVVAALGQDPGGEGAVGRERVRRRHAAGQVPAGRQPRGGGDLVALVGHRRLRRDAAVGVADEADRVEAGAAPVGAAHRLAVDGQPDPGPVGRRGGGRQGGGEGGQAVLARGEVDGAQRPAQGGRAGQAGRRRVGEGGQLLAVLGHPRPDRADVSGAAGEGGGDQGRQQGPGGAAAAPGPGGGHVAQGGAQVGRPRGVHRRSSGCDGSARSSTRSLANGR